MTDRDLIERLRYEADISDRPGQMDRLNALADEFAAAQINDGGPAFPESGPRGMAVGGEGMALRDYFAAKAMAALIAEPLNEGESSTAWRLASQLQTHTQMSGPDIIAHAAYMMADAMLKAREGER